VAPVSDAGQIGSGEPPGEWRAFDGWRVHPGPRVTTRAVGGAMVLYDTGTGVYFSLDPIGARAWDALVSSASIAEAFATLLAAYQVESERLRDDLEALITQLSAQRLVEVVRVG
jgi:hypothetical protein